MTITPKKRRLFWVISSLLITAGFALILMTSLNDHLLFFVTPTDLTTNKTAKAFVRLGGTVVPNSVNYQGKGIRFLITDGQHTLEVRHQGIFPALFREGQQAIAEGIWIPEGYFLSSRLLAKHDETYGPCEPKK